MDRATIVKLTSFVGFILATGAISWTIDGSYVLDRPVQSCCLGFFLVGWAVFSLHIILPRFWDGDDRNNDGPYILSERFISPNSIQEIDTISPRAQRIAFGFAVITICARVEVFRQTLEYRQCTVPGIEGLLPCLVSIREYLASSRRDKHHESSMQYQQQDPSIISKFVTSPFKLVGPAALIATANYLAAHVSASPRSTYICPTAYGGRQWTLLLQCIGVMLDCAVLFLIQESLRKRSRGTSSLTGKAPVVIGALLVISSCLLTFLGAIACIIVPEYRTRIRNIETAYFGSLIWMSLLFTLVITFAIRLLTNGTLLDFVMIVSFTSTFIIGFSSSWTTRMSFPGSLQLTAATSLILLFVSIVLYLRFNSSSKNTSAPSPLRFFGRPPRSFYALLLMMFLVRVAVDVTPNNEFDGHPIDKLVAEATELHNVWSRQIATSKTLPQAVLEYRRRYKRQPPPHFDKWYEYATSRNSLIIDDYDSMYEDLLPFWALEPQDLRARTREILSDPWNEVAEVTIRSGSAEIGESLVPTHRWMVAGAIEMMKDFIGWLPDMDLALNINDESRVAIPHEVLQELRKLGAAAGRSNSIAKDNYWSTNRAQSWELEEEPRRMFEDASFTNTFYNYGTTSCPPDSPARRKHIWDHRTLCTSCLSPHSRGPFLRNWTLSASPCHQPDLANLHGFYLSPGAFKTAHQPMPVFSQSKAHGYADILYPSPWNYMDKVKYDPSPAGDVNANARPDPPFSEKKNTLFWRGATSEGVSVVGTWKGMARQRLVHLANNHTSNIPILLPNPSDSSIQKYEFLAPKEIKSHPYLQNTTMDIAIVDMIVRCRDNCPPQEAEFGLVPPIEFQEHWRYRYLMDMDGAGFSGRFLPFLQSHSLVFKSALFREWYDTRITAWRHFVPIDLRLHGLWSTLAYFAGGGKDGDASAGRVKEAEAIAEQGREWVGKVLRKEDMEIYFFRLLLEWARLTDDRRDEIGFEISDINK